jgi:hypothetical protein
MERSISRLARRPLVHGWISVILLAVGMVIWLIAPAFTSRDRLDKLRKEETPKDCIAHPDDRISNSVPSRQQTQQQGQSVSSSETARDENEQRELTACLSNEQIAVASRANVIAIEAATTATGSAFIAYLAAIVSIVALIAVLRGARGTAGAFISVEFVPSTAGGDVGTLRIHNRGPSSALLDSVVVNGSTSVRSAVSNGLIEVPAGTVSDYAITLIDRGGSRCFVNYKNLHGSDHELELVLIKNSVGWHAVNLKKHR